MISHGPHHKGFTPLPASYICPITLLQGEITRIIPHRATGRADYFGPPVNRAARFLAASAPGQILAERSLVEGCVQAWSLGDLVGCATRMQLRHMYA
jgi:hypothetical protein